MEDNRIRIVLDTVIYLQASINESNVASSVLRRVEAGEVVLYVSHRLQEEVRVESGLKIPSSSPPISQNGKWRCHNGRSRSPHRRTFCIVGGSPNSFAGRVEGNNYDMRSALRIVS